MASSSEASRKSDAFERERGSFEKEEELSSVAQMTEIRSQLRNLLGSSPPLFGTDESETDTDKLLPKQPFSLPFRNSSASLLESLSLTPPRGDQKILTQNLERERLRRKMCEEKVYELERKVLFVEQQLAVALSVNKKRDTMIGQLEKTLGDIVCGWQRKEEETKKANSWLQERNAQFEEQVQRFKQESLQLQIQVDELRQECQNFEEELVQVRRLRMEETEIAEREKNQLAAQLNQEKEKVAHFAEENERIVKTLERERVEKENQIAVLESKWKKVEEDNWDLIQEKKEKTSNHMKSIEDYEERLSSTQRIIQEFQIERQKLEKKQEDFQQELSLKHDAYLAGLTKQKAELTAAFEAQIRKRTMEVQNEDNEREERMKEEHRAQLDEVKFVCSEELKQVKRYWEKDVAEKEKSFQAVCRDYEERLRILTEMLSEEQETSSKMKKSSNELSGKLRALIELQCQQSVELVEEVISQQDATPEDGMETRKGNAEKDLFSSRRERRETARSDKTPPSGSSILLSNASAARDEELRSHIETLLHRFPSRPLGQSVASRPGDSTLFSPLDLSGSPSSKQSPLYSYSPPKSDKSTRSPRSDRSRPDSAGGHSKVRRNLDTKYPKTKTQYWK